MCNFIVAQIREEGSSRKWSKNSQRCSVAEKGFLAFLSGKTLNFLPLDNRR